MDLGLFLLRLLLGALLFGHGTQKLAGWFSGHGPAGTAPLFEMWGFRPGRPLVILAGASEVAAAVLLVVGLFTPLGAAMAIGTMTVAGSVNAAKGLWATGGGYELPLVYAGTAAVLAFTGPGGWSLDAALGLAEPSTVIGVAAVLLGLVTAGIAIALARRNLKSSVAPV